MKYPQNLICSKHKHPCITIELLQIKKTKNVIESDPLLKTRPQEVTNVTFGKAIMNIPNMLTSFHLK